MVLNQNFKNQSGMSLAEALMAVVISTIVMGTAYFIYNNFQQTFVRQLNHSVIKQEVRFAVHSLQLDLRMAGYKHIDSSDNISDANAIRLFDASNNAVTDGNDADRVSACFDHENNDGTVQRKIVEYEIGIEQTGDTDKTILKKRIYDSDNCTLNNDDTMPISWEPVAKHFKKFKIQKKNNILNFDIELEDPGEKIIEKYSAAAFMRNVSY
ncbi:MAG: prepilin-type N-terminal cleavage/methylation domain-containing protein [Pelagibacteraceae bacterium]|nr:prepilin-type N-terminal cleavage/methylation domain-containing protein [Pelagibacteraceae bacterium]MCI5079075.1 prepilin-type N-terminal cleavage/methylation domain-containing protein [Pelagibacteraceae bacterium]